MPFTTWIRDALGIRKDVVDTKKAKLEIAKLEAEERERNLITPATLDDVKQYDPKYRTVRRKTRYPKGRRKGVRPRLGDSEAPHIIGWLIVMVGILSLATFGIVKLFRYLLR